MLIARFRCLVPFLVFFATTLKGQSVPNLIDVIPDDAGLVVGLKAHNRAAENRDFFVPIPDKSRRDSDYFRSLCGADPRKIVDEVIFADGDLAQAGFEHTLIARGRFDAQILYKSALKRGAILEDYRGRRVMRVPPLSRERSESVGFNLLAIIDSRVLLLGTPEYVRLEIDRLLTSNISDPVLVGQRAAVGDSDVWWIVRKSYDTSMIKKALMSLSPELAAVMDHSRVCVGTRYGKKVEFVYQIENPLTLEPARHRVGFTMVADQDVPYRRVVKVPRSRYRRWVTEIASNIQRYR